MKKVIMALCLIWSLAFVSCENWLDVKPKKTVEEEELFSREIGFKEALTAAYINWDVIVRCQSVVFTVGK